ncbi:transposase [Streptomyces sp. NPDC085929]|uniref:transposase n=1 Tax=Streptomyces sp. NPDC085929 TaxID=3365739 RepID=UPI0037CD442C
MGDRPAAAGLLMRLRRMHRDITLVWADGGYTGGLVGWCRDKLALTLEIVKRTDDMAGFVVLPRRWVAERTSQNSTDHVRKPTLHTRQSRLQKPEFALRCLQIS